VREDNRQGSRGQQVPDTRASWLRGSHAPEVHTIAFGVGVRKACWPAGYRGHAHAHGLAVTPLKASAQHSRTGLTIRRKINDRIGLPILEAADWMQTFDPIRDFFEPRQARRLSNRLPVVHLQVDRTECNRDTFLFPAPMTFATVVVDSQPVGTIRYGINPLGDRLYISEIKIDPAHQRRGYALSVLWLLHLSHHLPIVPLHIWGSAYPFWTAAGQQFRAAGATIEKELRTGELDEAKQRWQHLVPELEHLRRIREYEASPEWASLQASRSH